jgi:hypothetical protein
MPPKRKSSRIKNNSRKKSAMIPSPNKHIPRNSDEGVNGYKLFDKYADENDPESMSIEGIGKFCEELGIDPCTDVRALVIPWRLGAKSRPGYISREEFENSMRQNKLTTIESIKNIVPALDPGFLERDEFHDFYKFAFKFSLEGTKRILDKELVMELLPIILDDARAPHLKSFIKFLGSSEYKVITKDQWDSFLLFTETTSLDCSDFDENGAWPLLLDDFVCYMKGGDNTIR